MLSLSLEAVFIIYYIVLAVVQNGEQKEGKDAAPLSSDTSGRLVNKLYEKGNRK